MRGSERPRTTTAHDFERLDVTLDSETTNRFAHRADGVVVILIVVIAAVWTSQGADQRVD